MIDMYPSQGRIVVSESFKIPPKTFLQKECRQLVLQHSKPDILLKVWWVEMCGACIPES